MGRVIRYEYRRPGKPVSVFQQQLVLDRPDAKVLLAPTYGGEPLRAAGRVIQEPGAPMVWFVFPEKWHDIGRFHLADGTFTGWYTNLVTPVEIKGETWSASDLWVDLWQPARGDPVWLDEDEFEAAVRARLLDRATHQRVLNERALIDLQVKTGAWPPPIARDIDLAQARRLLDPSAFGRLGSL